MEERLQLSTVIINQLIDQSVVAMQSCIVNKHLIILLLMKLDFISVLWQYSCQ